MAFPCSRHCGAGCLLSGLGWVSSAYAASLTSLYLTYGLFCGIGTGIVYVGIIGLVVRWFPDRRGLATGVVAAGYGFGAILTTFPIDTMMKQAGYQHTLVVFGIIHCRRALGKPKSTTMEIGALPAGAGDD